MHQRFLLTLACLALALQSAVAGDPWPTRLDAAAAALAAQRAVPATGVTLVQDGKPVAVIVHDEAGKQAAGLLNEWIELMSGTKLELATEAPAGQTAIYVGTFPDAWAGVEQIECPTPERISIRADGTVVRVLFESEGAGGRAVGRFLEEAFGCRWVTTSAWGRMYLQSKTLRVRDLNLVEGPKLVFRRIWGANGAFRDWKWSGWNGHGGTSIPMSHSWGFLKQVDFEQHPDWFRMDSNGQRAKGDWPNFGNPELRQAFIDAAVTEAKNGTRSISLSPPDSYHYDYSPEATKYDNPNVIVASSGMVSMTDRFMGIVNEAATKIYSQGQDSIVSFYAYSDYTMPPTRPELDKLSPNVCVWIAPIRYSRYHPIGHPNSRSRQELLGIVDGWAERASMLGYRTYNYNLAEMLTPFSKLTIWSHDIPYLYSRGCIGMNLESFDSNEIMAPHVYLSIRLSYDPTLDPDAIIADYMVATYGPAAPAMADYWRAIDDNWVNQRTESGSIHVLPQVYTPEFLAALDGMLKRAETASADSPMHARAVEADRRGWQRATYWRTWFDQINTGKVIEAQATKDAWAEFVTETRKRRDANEYEMTYLNRFIGGITKSAVAAVAPKDLPARKVIAVLPDVWRYARGNYVGMLPEGTNAWDVNLDDGGWAKLATYSSTLSAQGHDDYFGDMWYRTTVDVPADATGPLHLHVVKADRKLTVFVNGKQVNDEELEAFRGATVDVSGHIKPGQTNQITLKIRHIPLPELYLGGLIAPVYLILGE